MVFLKINALSLLLAGIFLSSIYNYAVPKIEGGSQALSYYQGKKIMVITLPIQQNASSDSLLYSLDTLGAAHQVDLAIVAVPSYEDGFTIAKKSQLQQWYRSKLGNYITVTNGVYTNKSSGSQQHQLFKWLTKASLNGIFEIDVEGAGSKFFVNANGELYSVMPPAARVSSKTVNRIINTQ
jgi:glutathione peroxidase-family protein